MHKTLGIFGGTFDPIHFGHLRMALELKQQLSLDEMRLIPGHKPPHREQPQVSSKQRLKMLQLALQDCPQLQWDDRELNREKNSYTYDTLREFREEFGSDISLVLCMGEDAFAGISTWYCWQEIIHLAHIVVIARPGWAVPDQGDVRNFLKQHQGTVADLQRYPAGKIVMQSLRLLPISATEIRQQITRGESPQFLLPDAVWKFIREKRLYLSPSS
jgi:nicotinate-nucleotide adenylyltransferase